MGHRAGYYFFLFPLMLPRRAHFLFHLTHAQRDPQSKENLDIAAVFIRRGKGLCLSSVIGNCGCVGTAPVINLVNVQDPAEKLPVEVFLWCASRIRIPHLHKNKIYVKVLIFWARERCHVRFLLPSRLFLEAILAFSSASFVNPSFWSQTVQKVRKAAK
jgi:hypothetical protein